MEKSRRRFLQTAGTTALSILAFTTGVQAGSGQDEEFTAPSIADYTLDQHGWSEIGAPDLPKLEDYDDGALEGKSWKFAAFADKDHRTHVKDQTDGRVDKDFKQIWAVKVQEKTEGLTSTSLWDNLGNGETAEAILNIDGTTEKIFESYATTEVLDGHLAKTTEAHRKAMDWSIDLASLVPYVGDGASYAADFVWNAKTTIDFTSSGSAYLSQYLFGLPATSESLGVDEEPVQQTIDYRGWYIDWMKDGVFYAAGGVYPQNYEEFSEQLGESLEMDLDLQEPDQTYGKEVLEILSNIN